MTTGTTPAPQVLAAGSIGAGALFEVSLGGSGSAKGVYLPLSYGTFTANSTSTVTVADTNVTATSVIIIQVLTASTQGASLPVVLTQTAGTGFTTKALASDVSVYAYVILG